MNHSAMISAGYLPCMTKSTCITKITKTVTIPFTDFKGDPWFSMSDFDYSTGDESDSSGTSSGASSDTSDEEHEKCIKRSKSRLMKYTHVANIVGDYISNIKGI
jgi:hypothetical protein